MLNSIWSVMIVTGIIYGVFTGNVESVANGVLDCAGEAVELCITMAGVTALWMGLMEIAKESGLIAAMTEKIQPFISFLFPKVPKDHPARGYIATNFVANILGLGWACTPAGLKAMEALAQLETERRNPEYQERDGVTGCHRIRSASNEMCTFLILNISSLQLIPVSVIAYRAQYGSASPTAVVGPAIIATLFSTVIGIVFVKVIK